MHVRIQPWILIPSCNLVLQPQIEGVRGVLVTTPVVNRQTAFKRYNTVYYEYDESEVSLGCRSFVSQQ